MDHTIDRRWRLRRAAQPLIPAFKAYPYRSFEDIKLSRVGGIEVRSVKECEEGLIVLS